MKQKPTKKCENGVQLRPASIEEAGLVMKTLPQKGATNRPARRAG